MTCTVTEVESFEIIWRKYAKLRIFVNPASNSKGLGEKRKIRTGGGLTIMEFRGHGGVMHFGISKGIGGLKYGSRPSVGTDIIWNRPMLFLQY